ncbi:hypothetical protein P0Y35_05850 [Kiritimatiellaeota bacterium B1221]|nr:hypothetical protein [Kiritimatiellaeota bacterium B1221]
MIPPKLNNPFVAGQVLKADQLEELRAAIQFLMTDSVIAGPGLLSSVIGGRLHLSTQRRRTTTNVLNQNQWELYQEDAVTNPLQVSMRDGILVSSNSATLYPLNNVKSLTAADVTDNTSTIYWLKVSVDKSSFQSYFNIWHVTSSVVETGATLPSDTLDIDSDTAGDIHFQIGTVTAENGAVTDITQDLSTSITVVFPLTLKGPDSGTHVLVSVDGDISWVEADTEPECPSESEE